MISYFIEILIGIPDKKVSEILFEFNLIEILISRKTMYRYSNILIIICVIFNMSKMSNLFVL